MKYLHLMIVVLLLAAPVASAQNMLVRKAAVQEVHVGGDDVFVPISKYIAAGNSEALSAWFADNLEIAVLARESDASRAQARQIVKTFFDTYTPRSFDVTHTAGRANMKYALGTLKAGGESFSVTIFVSNKGRFFKIQQLKIEQQ